MKSIWSIEISEGWVLMQAGSFDGYAARLDRSLKYVPLAVELPWAAIANVKVPSGGKWPGGMFYGQARVLRVTNDSVEARGVIQPYFDPIRGFGGRVAQPAISLLFSEEKHERRPEVYWSTTSTSEAKIAISDHNIHETMIRLAQEHAESVGIKIPPI